jgi:hypothetical protein
VPFPKWLYHPDGRSQIVAMRPDSPSSAASGSRSPQEAIDEKARRDKRDSDAFIAKVERGSERRPLTEEGRHGPRSANSSTPRAATSPRPAAATIPAVAREARLPGGHRCDCRRRDGRGCRDAHHHGRQGRPAQLHLHRACGRDASRARPSGTFDPPLEASAQNVAIVVSLPSLGAGNTNTTVNARGLVPVSHAKPHDSTRTDRRRHACRGDHLVRRR